MATNPVTAADLEKLRRDLDTRLKALEQKSAARPAADPAVAALRRYVDERTRSLDAAIDRVLQSHEQKMTHLENAIKSLAERENRRASR